MPEHYHAVSFFSPEDMEKMTAAEMIGAIVEHIGKQGQRLRAVAEAMEEEPFRIALGNVCDGLELSQLGLVHIAAYAPLDPERK